MTYRDPHRKGSRVLRRVDSVKQHCRSCCLTKKCYLTDFCRFAFFFSIVVCLARSARPPAAFNVSATHTSAGVSADLRRPPRMSSFTRSARHALTRRCNVRSWTLLAYASGNIEANRSINTLAGTEGSAISHPSINGHASANGSTRLRHQCVAFGCFRCVGRASPSFHADERLARKTATAGSSAGAALAHTP